MLTLFRWLSLPISLITNWIAIIGQILYTPYFLIRVAGKEGQPLTLNPQGSLKELIEKAKQDVPDAYGFIRPESHTLLQQAGNGYFHPKVREKLLEQTIKESGSLYRRYPDEETWLGPSGDGISSWVFSYILWEVKRPDLVEKLALHYLKNAFGLDWAEGGGVSNRSSNGGVAPVVDAWPKGSKWWPFNWGFAQPTTGPAFFTTQALLGLAKKELGGMWSILYYLHWWLYGGWYYSIIPVMHIKGDTWYYTWHITSLNLWSLNKLEGGYTWGLWYLADYIAPQGNAQPMLCALAWDAGAISYQKRDQAINTLLSIQGAHYWPQHAPLDQFFLEVEKDNTNKYSIMGLMAALLSHKR